MGFIFMMACLNTIDVGSLCSCCSTLADAIAQLSFQGSYGDAETHTDLERWG